MISHKHKFIFIHIPKCGGTSVELALLKNEGIEMKNYNKDDLNFLTEEQKQKYRIGYDYEGITTQHRKIDEYKDFREKEYFTFTFIRNPWERFLSEYFYIIKSGPQSKIYGYAKEFQETFPTFKDFVKGNYKKWIFTGHDHLQVDFVLNANKNKMINFIGRCEDMQTDFEYVCKKLGMNKIKLPYRNPTKHKHYTEYYDKETKEIVANIYNKDIEYFGYKFGK
jgi:hypothetical protein